LRYFNQSYYKLNNYEPEYLNIEVTPLIKSVEKGKKAIAIYREKKVIPSNSLIPYIKEPVLD